RTPRSRRRWTWQSARLASSWPAPSGRFESRTGSTTMKCPDFGTWRARLDGGAGGSADLDSHVAACERCRALVEELRADAAHAAALIGALAPAALSEPGEVAFARQRLDSSLRDPRPRPESEGEGRPGAPRPSAVGAKSPGSDSAWDGSL